MENEQLFDQMVQLLGQIVTSAGADWALEFLQGGVEAAQEAGGGGQQPPMPPQGAPPEVMSEGGPGAMPPAAPMPAKRGMLGRRIN